jgi:G3E family GTPase
MAESASVASTPATAPGRARLPLTVIGGFLGAGKTTLLNRLLAQSQGRRLAVLVNDFGALNIDAELIASADGDTVALTNGCVCCSIGDDLTQALIVVLESPTPFDAVVIEASGVSDPWRIAQVGLADPGLVLDGVLVLVDASAALEQSADPLLADSLQRQLKSADFIVVNKCDLVDDAQRRRVREWVAAEAPSTPVFETVNAVVPEALLKSPSLSLAAAGLGVEGGRIEREGPGEPHDHAAHSDHAHEHGHTHDHATDFETWSCRPAQPIAANTLRTLLRHMPPGVLRLKGLVQTDEHGWAEIQYAGRHGSLRKALSAPNDGAAVVAIGLTGRLPVADLTKAFSR